MDGNVQPPECNWYDNRAKRFARVVFWCLLLRIHVVLWAASAAARERHSLKEGGGEWMKHETGGNGGGGLLRRTFFCLYLFCACSALLCTAPPRTYLGGVGRSHSKRDCH